MKNSLRKVVVMFASIAISLIFGISCIKKPTTTEDYTGSSSCIECHASFYELWSTSHHGLAMQAITSSFIKNKIQVDQDELFMEDTYFKALVKDTLLLIQERKGDSLKNYEVLWALGGKNVYYFLCEFEGGKLQTLPLAYNVNTKLWYNNPESAIRHFPNLRGQQLTDEALSWKDRQYTFNTSCYSCHVSQFSNNYDLDSNTYQTHWKESGINCETCHGPAGEHVKAAKMAEKKGKELTDLKLIVTSTFTPEQHNASCAPCHAKMRAITPSYLPGERYFDNYDLITLENTDFYPDGRDLGENYTMTSWHMNTCVKEGELHCVTCHTSSGRYRFESDDLISANKACTSCHSKNGENYEQHTHHSISAVSPKCIDCHMPMTSFGHMNRSDHSFRPPMPKASIEFGSPNACNLCHVDQSAEWSQTQLNKWGKDKGYQEETLEAARLIQQARTENWDKIDEILDAISKNTYGEVFTTSLLRLLNTYTDTLKKEAAINALSFESPLTRSAAAGTLLGILDRSAQLALLKAANDDVLLVRINAVISLSVFPANSFNAEQQALVSKVMDEYTHSLLTRPDDWSAHYNLGNHYQNLGQTDKALASYETATKVHPEAILPLVNSSYLYSISGNQLKAEENLKLALQTDSMNEAANFNYGLLMAEENKMELAEKALRNVITVNPNNASAAYNLAIIVSKQNLDEACTFSKIAIDANPNDPKFAYTYAFFLNQNKNTKEAIRVLIDLNKTHPSYLSSVFLLGQIYEEKGRLKEALNLFEEALENNKSDQQTVMQLQQNINRIRANIN